MEIKEVEIVKRTLREIAKEWAEIFKTFEDALQEVRVSIVQRLEELGLRGLAEEVEEVAKAIYDELWNLDIDIGDALYREFGKIWEEVLDELDYDP